MDIIYKYDKTQFHVSKDYNINVYSETTAFKNLYYVLCSDVQHFQMVDLFSCTKITIYL